MLLLFAFDRLVEYAVSLIAVAWKSFIELEAPFLAHLDPSHFQNVIIGILAIFIPYSIVFLTKIVNTKEKNNRSEFEQLVLSNEVLQSKLVFGISIFGLFGFSYLDGENLSTDFKVFASISIVVIIRVLWKLFSNILRFAGGNSQEFEISFLKKLSFSKYLTYKNKDTADKMRRSWESIWSEENIVEEQKFTEIFISHLNKAEASNKHEDIGNLLEIYLRNIYKRKIRILIDQVIPRVLDTHYANWEHYSKGRGEKPREELRHFRQNMHLCTNILKSTISLALKPTMMYQTEPPWYSVASHITKIELLYQQLNQDELLLEYIRLLISDFCNIFFNEIGNSPSASALKDSGFPEEWRLTSANYKKIVPQLLHTEFIHWAKERVSKIVQSENYDKNVTELICILFPSIDHCLFSTFLMIYYDNNIASVIEKYRNFIVVNLSIRFISQEQKNNLESSPENDQQQEQRKETAAVIVKYFDWPQSSLTSESEIQNFNKRSKEELVEYLNTKITEAERKEFKKLCQNDQRKEDFREEIIDFYNFMITELENNPDLLKHTLISKKI